MGQAYSVPGAVPAIHHLSHPIGHSVNQKHCPPKLSAQVPVLRVRTQQAVLRTWNLPRFTEHAPSEAGSSPEPYGQS